MRRDERRIETFEYLRIKIKLIQLNMTGFYTQQPLFYIYRFYAVYVPLIYSK